MIDIDDTRRIALASVADSDGMIAIERGFLLTLLDELAALRERVATAERERDALHAAAMRVEAAWSAVYATDGFEADREHDAAHAALTTVLSTGTPPTTKGTT